MKLKNKQNEEFSTPEARQHHFEIHQVKDDDNEFAENTFADEFEYENKADILAKTPVTTSNLMDENSEIVGFVMIDGARLKYNKKTKEVVIYVPDTSMKSGNKIITYYKGSNMRYLAKLKLYSHEINKQS